MNKAESLIYGILRREGYNQKQIYHNPIKSPDFILSDGREIEVKKPQGKSLIFTGKQINELKDVCEIWVIDKDIIYTCSYKDLRGGITPYNIISPIPLSKETNKQLKQLREDLFVNSREKVIIFLIKFYKKYRGVVEAIKEGEK